MEIDWPSGLHGVFRQQKILQVSYVPDAGHARLIDLCAADETMRTVPLTTEEEGVAHAAGAWLGGQRSVLLMQSSGVGNCINMFSLIASCRFPFVTLVTMRGEYAEFNPWQVPMGSITDEVLKLAGLHVRRVTELAKLVDEVEAACEMAFNGNQAFAVLISQSLIGRKKWVK